MKRSTTTSAPTTVRNLRGQDGQDSWGRLVTSSWLPGPGIVGPSGLKGDTGAPGLEGGRGAGVAYVHWDH